MKLYQSWCGSREKIDVVKLNAEIDEIVKKEDELRKEINKIIAEL